MAQSCEMGQDLVKSKACRQNQMLINLAAYLLFVSSFLATALVMVHSSFYLCGGRPTAPKKSSPSITLPTTISQAVNSGTIIKRHNFFLIMSFIRTKMSNYF